MTAFPRTLAAIAIPLAVVACGSVPSKGTTENTLAASNVPAALAVPSGNKLAFKLRGSGVQNYECRAKAGAPGGHEWTLTGPEAALYDRSDTLVGRHYAGPTWEYGDDSKVTGKVLADAAAPTAGSVSWLLLQGTPANRGGVLSGVTYIQRVNTDGGVAPSDACTSATVGTKKGVRLLGGLPVLQGLARTGGRTTADDHGPTKSRLPIGRRCAA